MLNESETKPVGKLITTVVNPVTQKTYKIEFVIASGECTAILGTNAILGMVLMKLNTKNFTDICAVFTESSAEENETCHQQDLIFDEFSDVFTGLGKLPGQLHLEVDESVPPGKIPTL